MARPPRIEFPGAVYHVMSRGNAGELVFRSASDRHCFLALLERVVGLLRWRLHAYCLMTTHYHLLVETPGANLAIGMHRVNGGYARWSNRRYGRRGHVFERRYHAVLVSRDAHCLEVARYIVLNPVRAGVCDDPGDWPWSSYAATAGLVPRPAFLTVGWVLGQLDLRPATARTRYMAYVGEGVATDARWLR